MAPSIALLLPFLLFGGIGRTVSYKKLAEKKAEQAFYRCGGASHRGSRIHIHVPAARIHAKPSKVVLDKGGRKRLVFQNRSVPLIVSPNNIYLRKAKVRTGQGDTLCVKGEVGPEPAGGGGRYAIFVHTFKEAP